MNEIIVALITGCVTLAGVLISNSKSQAVTETRLEELPARCGSTTISPDATGFIQIKEGRQPPLYLTFQNICFVRILFMKVSLCGIKHFNRNYFGMIPTI